MKKIACFLLLCMIITNLQLNAQSHKTPLNMLDRATLGLGMGLDYGGFGINYTFFPMPRLGLFAGAGYALAGFGFNGGIKYRLVSETKPKKVVFYGMAMYGYNAAIFVLDDTELNKLFYGLSFGAGLETGPKDMKKGYWSFAILLPVRSPDVDIYMDELRRNHNVEFQNELLPIAISVGYHFIIQR